MARPIKKGLDYFSLDADIFTDRKIRTLYARFGAEGFALYTYLLCQIFREGYYMEFDEDLSFVISLDLNMSLEKIKTVMGFMLDRSLFDKGLFMSDSILTSKGIQRRYQLAVRVRAAKRKIVVEEKYWLLDDEETEGVISVHRETEEAGGAVSAQPKAAVSDEVRHTSGHNSTADPRQADFPRAHTSDARNAPSDSSYGEEAPHRDIRPTGTDQALRAPVDGSQGEKALRSDTRPTGTDQSLRAPVDGAQGCVRPCGDESGAVTENAAGAGVQEVSGEGCVSSAASQETLPDIGSLVYSEDGGSFIDNYYDDHPDEFARNSTIIEGYEAESFSDSGSADPMGNSMNNPVGVSGYSMNNSVGVSGNSVNNPVGVTGNSMNNSVGVSGYSVNNPVGMSGNSDNSGGGQRIYMEIPCKNGWFEISEEQLVRLKNTYPRMAVEESLKKLKGYLIANPHKQGSKSTVSGYIDMWLAEDNRKGRYRKPDELEPTYDIAEYESHSVIDDCEF